MKKRIMAYFLCFILLFTNGNIIQASEVDMQQATEEMQEILEADTEEDTEKDTEEIEDTESSTEEIMENSTETEIEGDIQEKETEIVDVENVPEEIMAESEENCEPVRAAASALSLSYSVHLSNGGWTSYAGDNSWCGNTGNSNTTQRIEAVKIKLNNTTGISGGIKYDVMRTAGVWSGDSFASVGGADKDGWTDWVTSNAVSGSVGTGQHIEAIRIRLTGSLADYYYVSYYVKTTTTPAGAGTISAPESYQWTVLGVNDESFLDKNPGWNPGAYSSSYDFAGTYNYTLPIEAIKTTIKNRKITYTVNPNGGMWNSSTDKTKGTMNTNSTKTFAAPTRSGYTFTGWTVTHSASGIEKDNGYQPVTNDIAGSLNTSTNVYTSGNMNVTLKANWVKNYTLTINANGGTYAGDTKYTLTYGTCDYNSIGYATRTGYTFSGWFDKSGTQVYDASGNALKGTYWSKAGSSGVYQYSGNLTVYAHWTPITYTVSYKGNGNTGGSTAASTHTYDTAQTLTANGFNKTGYSFTGWNTKADGSGTAYANKASVKNLTSKDGSTIKLYAQWTPKTYTLTYNGNGGTTPDAQTALYDSVWGNLAVSTRTGYDFTGWYDSVTGGTQITSDTVCTGNKTVYAHWTPITYTISYDGNGNTEGKTDSSTHTYDVVGKLTANGYARAGYTFTGWNTKEDGSGKAYADKDSIKNLTTVAGKTITLYAQWSLNTVSVSVPRSLILNTDGYCSFSIKADNETGTITVNPDKTINLTQEGKDQVIPGTVSMEQNTLTADRHEIVGTINAGSLTAGTWKATLNLNITFEL